MDQFADSIFHTAVRELQDQRSRLRPDYQQPVIGVEQRELIIARLLKHQRVVYAEPGACYDLVEDCLIALGVTNAELLKNLKGAD